MNNIEFYIYIIYSDKEREYCLIKKRVLLVQMLCTSEAGIIIIGRRSQKRNQKTVSKINTEGASNSFNLPTGKL